MGPRSSGSGGGTVLGALMMTRVGRRPLGATLLVGSSDDPSSWRLRIQRRSHVRAFKVRKIEEGLNPNTVGVMQGVLNAALN